ncbi:MAG: cupin domain-containing protein [Oscillospiraceae bacterium]
MNVSENLIKEVVQQVIRENLNNNNTTKDSFYKETDKSGVFLVRSDTVKTEQFEDNKNVYVKDVAEVAESPRIGAGIMELKDGVVFPWTLKYDEYDFVIEGTLQVEVDGKVFTANKGDIIHIPKDASIKFKTPSYARFAYFVYPANWQDL